MSLCMAAILLRPVIPMVFLAVIVVAAAAAAWHTYRRCSVSLRERLVLWGLRIGAILIIAWLLLQAERRNVHLDAEAPVLAVVLDVSASMNEEIAPDVPTRRARALDFLRDRRVARACRRYRMFKYEVGATVEERPQTGGEILFNAPRSYIGSGLGRIVNRLRAENVAGIILISDGLDHSGAELPPEALRIPIFIPELEDPVDEDTTAAGPDAWVAEVSYPKMIVVNWKASADVLVRRRGNEKTSFPIHFRQGGRVLRTSMVEFEANEQFRQVSFSVEPQEVGQLLYQVEIVPKQDSVAANNTRDFLIDVTDPKNRVLYLEGAPRWEFKFLKRALLAEKNYELSAFVRGGDGNFISFSEVAGMSGGQAPQFTSEALSGYKVIIIGDLPGTALKEPDCRQIRDFVDKGGGLLFLGAAQAYGEAGLQTAPYLDELFPATSGAGARMNEGRFSVDLTATGRASPALSGLPHEMRPPPILSFWAPVEVSELSSTLIATADGSPVLVIRRYGQGRVAMILSDSLWRWQMGGVEDGSEKTLYSRFVTQLVYWLAPSEKDVERTGILQALVASGAVELRQNVTIGAICGSLADGQDPPNCKITTPEGRQLAFSMVPAILGSEVGLSRTMDGFKCTFSAQVPGKYEVMVSTSDGTQQVPLTLLASEPEHERTGAPLNRSYLQQLASDTGGRFVRWRDRYEMFDEVPYKASEVRLVEEYPIWNRWWVLVLLVVLFSVEWWWRRQLDLV